MFPPTCILYLPTSQLEVNHFRHKTSFILEETITKNQMSGNKSSIIQSTYLCSHTHTHTHTQTHTHTGLVHKLLTSIMKF